MSSRRGRLNWSNIDIHISDEKIENQHRFTCVDSNLLTAASNDNTTQDENETNSKVSSSVKRTWKPKVNVGEINVEEFVGNFMLTKVEETALSKKYDKQVKRNDCSKISLISKRMESSNELADNENVAPPKSTMNLSVGQRLSNVFVCHVKSYSCVYITFGKNYEQAKQLFHDMNTCSELVTEAKANLKVNQNDLVAVRHDGIWFRGRCLAVYDRNFDIFCIDTGVVVKCSSDNLCRLPDM